MVTTTIPWLVAATVFLIALVAERQHARKISAMRLLIFGRHREASTTSHIAPLLKILGLAAIGWGMTTLLLLPPRQRLRDPNEATAIDPMELKRVLLVLDVSPSMRIKDAAGGTLTRAQRAADVLMNMLSRVDFEKARVTVAAFYTGVKPVVIDAIDPNVIHQIVYNNTFDQAFEDGDTDLGVGIRGAYDLAKNWRPDSTTLIIVTDGDSTPVGTLPARPPAINRVLFLGVGNTERGTFIDDHMSRQDAVQLQSLAGQLGGHYADADDKNVPTDLLSDLSGMIESRPDDRFSLREAALLTITVGAVFVSSVSMLLAMFGTQPRTQSGGGEQLHGRLGVAA